MYVSSVTRLDATDYKNAEYIPTKNEQLFLNCTVIISFVYMCGPLYINCSWFGSAVVMVIATVSDPQLPTIIYMQCACIFALSYFSDI